MKSILPCLLFILLSVQCKKDATTTTPEDKSIEAYYKANNLEYIATIKKEAAELSPCFIGQLPDASTFKIIYLEKKDQGTFWHSLILDHGVPKEWTSPFNQQYTYAELELDRKGYMICNAEYVDFAETSDNQFALFANNPMHLPGTTYFKHQGGLMAFRPNYDNTEVIYYKGRQYRNMDVLSGYDATGLFNQKTSFTGKLWNHDLSEYDGNQLLFIYTKGTHLYASLLDKDFKKTLLDSMYCKPSRMHSGCDFAVEEGFTIRIIGNSLDPYIVMGKEYGDYQHTVYRLNHRKLQYMGTLEPGSITTYHSLFSYRGQLYQTKNNRLQRLEGSAMKDIPLNPMNILGIYGSEAGIYLAGRKAGELYKDHFDLVRYEP